MHPQDRRPAGLVGPVHHHLPVKAPGAQQGGVKDLGPVGGGKQDDPVARVEAVKFRQQLVQRLLFLVISPAQATDAARRPRASSSSMKMMQGAALRA